MTPEQLQRLVEKQRQARNIRVYTKKTNLLDLIQDISDSKPHIDLEEAKKEFESLYYDGDVQAEEEVKPAIFLGLI